MRPSAFGVVVFAAVLIGAGCGGDQRPHRAKAGVDPPMAAAFRGWEGALIGFGSRLDVCTNSVTPSPGFWSGCVGRERRAFRARTLTVRHAFGQGGDARCHRAERPAQQLVVSATHTLTAASTAMGRLLRSDRGPSRAGGGAGAAPLLMRADAIVSRSPRVGPRLLSLIVKDCR